MPGEPYFNIEELYFLVSGLDILIVGGCHVSRKVPRKPRDWGH